MARAGRVKEGCRIGDALQAADDSWEATNLVHRLCLDGADVILVLLRKPLSLRPWVGAVARPNSPQEIRNTGLRESVATNTRIGAGLRLIARLRLVTSS